MPVAKLATLTIAEYLMQRPRPVGEGDGRTSEVLIFDQFEEILTIDPTNQEDKSEFFAQVGAALRDRQRWALFSIREDYVGALDPYIRPIPTRMSNRYRLDLLGPQTAQHAIQSPARGVGVDFHDSAAKKLVDDLRRVQVQQPDCSMQETLGVYV